MSERGDRLGRLWRTLQPLPVQSHAFRVVNEARKRAWRPVLPALVTLWRQRGAEVARRARPEPLLALGRQLEAAPQPPAGELLAGRLHLAGREIAAFPPADWRLPGARPLEVYEAHYLGWADALVAAAVAGAEPDAQILDLAGRALRAWRDASTHVGPAWEPYPRARRLLTCLQAAARLSLLLRHGADRLRTRPGDGGPAALRDMLLEIAATAAADLGWFAERHLDGNHLLVDRIALAAAEATWGAADETTARRAALREAARQFPGDGSHVEQSPMYHALLLEDLLVLRALLEPAGDRILAETDALVAKAAGWLAAVRHPDGALPAFGDSDPGIVASLPLVRTALTRTPRGRTEPTQSAWVSRHGGQLAIVHTAPPVFPPQPGHAHADSLSVEWSRRDHRLLADAGLGGYEGDPHRALNRSEASHSTVEVPGVPALELWSAFRVGARGQVRHVQAGRLDAWDWVAAVHVWPGDSHRLLRLVAHHPAGRLLLVDRLQARRGPHEAVGRLLLAPGVALGEDQTLLCAGDVVRVEADAPLLAAIGLRFVGRGETRQGPELRYPIAAPGCTWVLLGGDAQTDLAKVRARFDDPWRALAAAADVG